MRELLRHIPSPIKNLIKRGTAIFTWDPWFQKSWSQEGEDRVLERFFGRQTSGFYVDVGAHHPKRFSNTFALYRIGWSGINIDPMPGSMKLFHKHRPRDINLEIGIAKDEGKLEYFIFNEPALNGFNGVLSQDRHTTDSKYKIQEVKEIPVRPLSEVLDEQVPSGTDIELMSIDVEGLDLEVLQSHDWEKYPPTLVLVEILKSSMHELFNSDVNRFMEKNGYRIYAKCVNTVFFLRE